jgi:hypothetical protein
LHPSEEELAEQRSIAILLLAAISKRSIAVSDATPLIGFGENGFSDCNTFSSV